MYGGGMFGGGMGMGPGQMRPGGMGPGQLTRAGALSDEEMYGKVYDQTVVVRLAKYLSNYKVRFTLAVLLTIVISVSSLGMIWLFSKAIDNITSGNGNDLNLYVLFYLGCGVANWGASWFQQYTLAHIGRGILFTIRKQMFSHVQKLSLGFFDKNEVGRIMSRIQNDVAALQDVITTGVTEILSDFLNLGLIIVILFTMNVQLTLLSLTMIPALAIVLVFYTRYSKNAFVRVRQAISNVNSSLQENISGARVIQALSRESINFQRFDNMNESNLDANMGATRLAAGLQGIVEIISGAAIMLLVIFGGAQAISGQLTLGQLIAFVLYVQRFIDPIRSLSLQYTNLQRATAGGVRIFEVLDTKAEIVDAPDAEVLPPVVGEIKFDHVSFHYLPGVDVLKDVNLDIKPGETIAFVGSTGAGKSTFVSLVPRFYEISSGSISIDGHDVRKVTQESLRRQIGMVLQEPFLFSTTIRENILYGRDTATEDEMIEAAKAVGAHDFVMRLEKGYDTVLHERGSNLSVGQRQLISFARAILSDPKILILDEATANIDTQTEILIQKALKKLLVGRTSLIIAHRLSTIQDANRVVVMDAGRIAEIGSHEELLEKGGLYHHLYTMSYALSNIAGTEAPTRHREAT